MVTKEVVIRRATWADASAIAAMLEVAWHNAYDAIMGRSHADEIGAMSYSLGAVRMQILFGNATIATAGTRVVAAAAYSESSPGTIFIGMLYVLPSHQRQGIGRTMIAAIQRTKPHANRMRLEVLVQNAGAINFYESLGFARHSTARPSVATGDLVFVLEKALRPREAVRPRLFDWLTGAARRQAREPILRFTVGSRPAPGPATSAPTSPLAKHPPAPT